MFLFVNISDWQPGDCEHYQTSPRPSESSHISVKQPASVNLWHVTASVYSSLVTCHCVSILVPCHLSLRQYTLSLVCPTTPQTGETVICIPASHGLRYWLTFNISSKMRRIKMMNGPNISLAGHVSLLSSLHANSQFRRGSYVRPQSIATQWGQLYTSLSSETVCVRLLWGLTEGSAGLPALYFVSASPQSSIILIRLLHHASQPGKLHAVWRHIDDGPGQAWQTSPFTASTYSWLETDSQ